ncbi:MAG: hypothetical protein AAGC60_29940 [Acidobacteriota bacterium]
MEWLRELSRWSHMIVGFTGLIAFWFPIVARKGGRLHRVAGKVFVVCGYWVTASAGLSCVLIAGMLARDGVLAEKLDTVGALVFLSYLAWVTFVMLRYSVGVLTTKSDPTQLATPQFRFLAVSALAASVGLIAFGALVPTRWSLLCFLLSPIGLGVGVPMLRYMSGRVGGPRAWFFEHMSATIGAGIAFHTAFAVFGLGRLVELPTSGWLSVLPWLLPTALGSPALIAWKRHYERKFDRPRRRPGTVDAGTVAPARG